MAVAAGDRIHVVGSDQTAGTDHALDDDAWFSGHVAPKILGDEARPGGIAAARPGLGDQPDRVAPVEALDRGIRLRVCGSRDGESQPGRA